MGLESLNLVVLVNLLKGKKLQAQRIRKAET